MGVDAREFPGGLLRLDPTLVYVKPPSQVEFLMLAPGREALYNQEKQDWELTVAQIMNSLLPNPDLN